MSAVRSEHPVYLRDLKRGTTVLLTLDATGGTATAYVEPGMIADGTRPVAFESQDPALNPAGDTNDAQRRPMTPGTSSYAARGDREVISALFAS